LRRPTAEQVFATWPEAETDSASLADDADPPLSADQLAWAKLILVMQASHRRRLMQRYGPSVKGKRIVLLDIRDDYDFMQPALIELFLRKAGPFLR